METKSSKPTRPAIIKSTLRYYYFNLDPDTKWNPKYEKQLKAYNQLCKKLKDQGLKKSVSSCSHHHKWYNEKIKPLNCKTIELETDYIFDNQWNMTNPDLRVFDWAEAIYPNKRIKEGQYIEQTEEMKEIRNTWHRCKWCGEVTLKSNGDYCSNKCKEGMEDYLKTRNHFEEKK